MRLDGYIDGLFGSASIEQYVHVRVAKVTAVHQ